MPGKTPMGIRAAAGIQFAAKYVNVLVSLAITMVLARILTPAEYGTVAVVSVFLGLFTVFSTAGVGAAVVQFRDLSDEECGSLLTFTSVFGVVLAGGFCALSPLVAGVYGDVEYVPLMCVGSLAILFNSANMVPNGVLLRDKRFVAVGVRLVVTSAAAGVVAVILALRGWGSYALVANTVVQSLLVLAWNLAASRMRPGAHPIAAIRRIFGFSAFQFGATVVQYLIRNLDNMLIGLAMGPAALGFYDKAYRLAKYPVDAVADTLRPVLATYFADFGGDPDGVWGMFVKVEKAYSVAGAFFTAVCVACPAELILLLFGDQWGAAVEPFRVLAASIVFQMMNYVVFAVLQGLKRTDLLLADVCANGVAMTVLLIAGLSTGNLLIVAAVVSVYFAVASTATFVYFVVRRAFARSIVAYLKLFVPEFASATAALLAMLAVDLLPLPGLVASLALKLIVGGIVYAALIKATGQGGYVRMLLPKRFRRG